MCISPWAGFGPQVDGAQQFGRLVVNRLGPGAVQRFQADHFVLFKGKHGHRIVQAATKDGHTVAGRGHAHKRGFDGQRAVGSSH